MKLIVCLMGLAGAVAFTGCESDEHEHHEHRGGAYDGTYQQYGHEYDRGYYGRDHWDNHDWRY